MYLFFLSGLYNDNLEDQSPFDSYVVDTLTLFLNRLPSPVCLLAHNGNNFDFPVLLEELKRAGRQLPETLLCADSISAFKDLDGYLNLYGHCNKVEGSSSQPTSRVTTPLDSLLQTTDLSSSLNLSRKTPVGQTIPENCSSIKERVRQMKRKCDASFDRCPSEAKAVKKRLFQSDENKGDKSGSGKENFAGSKPSTLEKLVSAKRFKPEVETVKKRLNFDSEEEDGSSDSSLNCSTDYEMMDKNIDEKSKLICDFNKNTRQSPLFDSQASIEDDVLLKEVEQIECQVPTFGMSGLDSPTYRPTFTNVPTSSAICVTPKKGEVTEIQTTNETTPVKNTLPAMSELKYTPVTQLTRCTEKVKLNTPKSSRINEQLKQLSANASFNSNHLSSNSFSAFVTASYNNTSTTNSNPFSVRSKVSYTLTNIYKRIFGCEPPMSHTAEDDCKSLLQCVKRKSPDFIRWVDKNAVLLSSIPPRS